MSSFSVVISYPLSPVSAVHMHIAVGPFSGAEPTYQLMCALREWLSLPQQPSTASISPKDKQWVSILVLAYDMAVRASCAGLGTFWLNIMPMEIAPHMKDWDP